MCTTEELINQLSTSMLTREMDEWIQEEWSLNRFKICHCWPLLFCIHYCHMFSTVCFSIDYIYYCYYYYLLIWQSAWSKEKWWETSKQPKIGQRFAHCYKYEFYFWMFKKRKINTNNQVAFIHLKRFKMYGSVKQILCEYIWI